MTPARCGSAKPNKKPRLHHIPRGSRPSLSHPPALLGPQPCGKAAGSRTQRELLSRKDPTGGPKSVRTNLTRSSSREVRIRVPTFFCSLFLYWNPPPEKIRRTTTGGPSFKSPEKRKHIDSDRFPFKPAGETKTSEWKFQDCARMTMQVCKGLGCLHS